MRERKLCRVQKVSTGAPIFPDKLGIRSFAVNIITHNGMSDGAQMHANLMGPSCPDSHLHERESFEPRQDPVFRMGRPASRCSCGHPCSVRGMTSYRKFDRVRISWKLSMNQTDVHLP